MLFHTNEIIIDSIVESIVDKCSHLIHLELKQGIFKENVFIQCINNINELKSIVLNKCSKISN